LDHEQELGSKGRTFLRTGKVRRSGGIEVTGLAGIYEWNEDRLTRGRERGGRTNGIKSRSVKQKDKESFQEGGQKEKVLGDYAGKGEKNSKFNFREGRKREDP